MEREPLEGRDVGRDPAWELTDEPPPAWRDAPPDILTPIDESAPVSGHVPPPEPRASATLAPEHDWAAAAALLYPALRPIGTQGTALASLDPAELTSHGANRNTEPLIDEGPCGLPVVYALTAGSYDVIVNGDHLLSWGVSAREIQDAAMGNLAQWSATAPWTDEVSGDRRLLSSDTGDGWDAVRILLPDVRAHLAREVGATGRVLVGLPERHLLVAGTLRPGDEEFGALFADFVVEQSGGADEPVDRRVFELVEGRLVPFEAASQATG
jgi:hypothetical protein